MKEQIPKPRPMNPLLPPQWHIPDGEVRVMPDGRLYLYGSCDESGEQYCGKRYFVASTEDFVLWTVDGPSLTTDAIPWLGKSGMNKTLDQVEEFDDLPLSLRKQMPQETQIVPIKMLVDIIRSQSPHLHPDNLMLYAPDAIERDGKYYLYFCLSDDSEGVAIADSPNGPFEVVAELPVLGIDPSIFVDDDGQAYYYWGQFSASGAPLLSDMLHIDESTIVQGLITEENHHFHEGSSIRKRNGIYYYVFADTSRGKPGCLGYATAKHPLGPYTYQGVIIDNGGCDPASWNNHGCIAEYKGQWYVFYHRSSQNSQYYRRACCEPIFFDADGHIPEVKMTSQGPGPAFASGEIIPAYTACEVSGGAYVDAEVLRPASGSTAVFRYLQGHGQTVTLRLFGSGHAEVQVLADRHPVSAGRMENGSGQFTFTAPKRDWELTLRFDEVQECTLDRLYF